MLDYEKVWGIVDIERSSMWKYQKMDGRIWQLTFQKTFDKVADFCTMVWICFIPNYDWGHSNLGLKKYTFP